MNITQVRLQNLQLLIKDKYKTRKEFAEHIGKSYSQVTSWFLETKGKKVVGEKLAREIEAALDLPVNSLDEECGNVGANEYFEALKSIGYHVTENSESFPYNELSFTPQYQVKKGQVNFLVTTMSSPLFNDKLIRIVSGLNVSHSFHKPQKVIVPICEDDLYFAKYGGLQSIIDKRLDLASNGSPFDISDFLMPIGTKKAKKEYVSLWDKLKEQWPKITSENKHSDAVLAAKQLLKLNEFEVFETPESKPGRLMVFNKVLWSLPSLIVYLPDKSKSFYIDIYPDKRFWIIPSLPDNKYPEILLVKQSEVIDIVPLVQNHIKTWF